MGVNVGPSVGYVFTVFALGYMTKQLGVPQGTALLALVIAALCGAVASILFGSLSDHIGRRTIMLLGSLFSAVYAFPFFWLLETRQPLLIIFAMVVGFSIGLRSVFGVQPAFYTELFETRLRFRHRAGAGDDGGAGRRPASACRHGRGRRGGRGVVAGRRADDGAGADYHPLRGNGADAGCRHCAGGRGEIRWNPTPPRLIKGRKVVGRCGDSKPIAILSCRLLIWLAYTKI